MIPLGGERHRVRFGDRFEVIGKASVIFEMEARVTVEYDDGRLRDFRRKMTTTAARTALARRFASTMEADGRVVRAIIINQTSNIQRGQVRGAITVLDANGKTVDILLEDYVENGGFLDVFSDTGPGGGSGHLSWRAIAEDVAPVDIVEVLAAANVYRRIYGFVWYYHCSSDVADRVLDTFIRAPGLGIPTGFSLAEVVNLPISAVTLSADQEGIVYAYKGPAGGGGFASKNDNGSIVTASTDTQAQVWPLEVYEDDLVEIRFNETNANANDRHSIYILQEEWLTP